ncbi:hypothetical protein NHJ6243_010065 [Beauveria neobassiana]
MSSSELFDDISDSFSATSSPQLSRYSSRKRSPSSSVPSKSRRKRGRTAHDTWSHSRDPRLGEPERDSKSARYWYCRYCENPMYRTLSTTSARRHLDKVHHIQLEAAEPAIKKKRDVHIRQIFEKQAVKAQQTQDQHHQEVFQSALNKGAISEALARLITVRNLSDRCVEWPEFHALLKLVNPAIENEVISSHSEVTKIIARTYEHHREALRDKLQLAKSKIHITVDVWSSPNRVPFLAICAHFVDETNWLLKTLNVTRWNS